MTVKINCQYYERQEIESDEISGSFDTETTLLETCNHPANNPGTVISKPCDTSNDYCPYKA